MLTKTPTPTKRVARSPKAPPAAAHSTEPAILPAPPARMTKLAVIVALASRTEGAHMKELMAATGWQAHSVRGALSGGVKKQLKLTVTSEKSEAGRVYRVIGEAKS